ncbi:MAG: PEP-CTERM sorting domain-containing protein [Phycisphaerales bacterium]
MVSMARNISGAALAAGMACAPASAALVQFMHTFVNTSGTAQDFTFTVSSDVAYSGQSLFDIQGSLALNLIDLNGNGATVGTNGVPMYVASIGSVNPTVVQTIWNQPWSFGVGIYGNGVPPDQVFAAMNVPVTPEAVQPLTITIRLRLSARDMVTVSGTFQAVPVPAPGAIALLAVAGVSGAGRRRRR